MQRVQCTNHTRTKLGRLALPNWPLLTLYIALTTYLDYTRRAGGSGWVRHVVLSFVYKKNHQQHIPPPLPLHTAWVVDIGSDSEVEGM